MEILTRNEWFLYWEHSHTILHWYIRSDIVETNFNKFISWMYLVHHNFNKYLLEFQHLFDRIRDADESYISYLSMRQKEPVELFRWRLRFGDKTIKLHVVKMEMNKLGSIPQMLRYCELKKLSTLKDYDQNLWTASIPSRDPIL